MDSFVYSFHVEKLKGELKTCFSFFFLLYFFLSTRLLSRDDSSRHSHRVSISSNVKKNCLLVFSATNIKCRKRKNLSVRKKKIKKVKLNKNKVKNCHQVSAVIVLDYLDII